MKIYLDDVRKPPPGWNLTTNVAETIEALKTGEVTHLSLDHDLSDEHYTGDLSKGGTGYDVLVWLEDEVQAGLIVPPAIFLHTMNPEGRRRMAVTRERIVLAYDQQMTWRKQSNCIKKEGLQTLPKP